MIILAIAAFGGGILSAIMGFVDSGEPFNLRKFSKSVIISLLAGIGVAVTSQSAQVGIKEILMAVLAGAGSDVVVNRAVGAFKK